MDRRGFLKVLALATGAAPIILQTKTVTEQMLEGFLERPARFPGDSVIPVIVETDRGPLYFDMEVEYKMTDDGITAKAKHDIRLEAEETVTIKRLHSIVRMFDTFTKDMTYPINGTVTAFAGDSVTFTWSDEGNKLISMS